MRVSISHPFISSSSFLFNYPGTRILIGSRTKQTTGNASRPPNPSAAAQVSRFKENILKRNYVKPNRKL